MEVTASKLTLAIIISVIFAEFQYYAPALVLLAICIITDYITGIIKAWNSGTLSSKIGRKGIIVKLCYLIGVAAGFGVDMLIRIAVDSAGFDFNTPFLIGLVVTLIFICNELLSIMENLVEIGVPFPKFIVKFLGKVKERLEADIKDP